MNDLLKLEAKALKLAKTQENTEETVKELLNPRVRSLLSEENISPVKIKLDGKRPRLTDDQKALATITQHMKDFKEILVAYLKNDPEHYALSYVLDHFNPERGNFNLKSRDFSKLIGNEGIKHLKMYSGLCEKLDVLYQPVSGDPVFTETPDKVADLLIGRSLIIPYKKKLLEAKILETEAFATDEDVTSMRRCMLAAPGYLDIMPFRGQKFVNIGTEMLDKPSCVMIRSAIVDGVEYEGPGRVGKVLPSEDLIGQSIGKEITLEGFTLPTSYTPGQAQFSLGKFRYER
jgi:hypothetical protein